MSVSQEPLSIRNNNPGNLRFANQPGATQGEGGFARFETPEAGLAAMQKQIELDTQTRGLTLDRFLNKYAPPSENKTQNYINFVAKKTGLDPTKPVPAERIADVQRAMIEMEGGPRSLSYFMTTRTVEAPSPGQVASVTPQATRPTVQVAGPTQLPASYRMALAANYLGDTEKDSVTDQAMKMLEEMQSEEGGSAGGFSKKMMSMLAPKETGEDPFALMAKAQEENAPKRRPVPRMPRMMAEGGEAVSDKTITDYLKANPTLTDRQIAAKMDEFNVSKEQMARATGIGLPEVTARYEATKMRPEDISPEVRQAVQSPRLTLEQYRTLSNYFNNPMTTAELANPAQAPTVRDFVNTPRTGFEFASFLATRGPRHGGNNQYGMTLYENLLQPYLNTVTTSLQQDEGGSAITDPITGQRRMVSQIEGNRYRVNYNPVFSGPSGSGETRTEVGLDYVIDPATGQAVLVSPYLNEFSPRRDRGIENLLGLAGTAAGMYLFPGMDFSNMISRGLITAGTEGAKRMFAEGGEVDKELSEEDRQKMRAEQEGRAMGSLRYQLGPLTAQVVRNPQGYEGRVSTPVGPVVPYMDFDPLTGTFKPTGYGMTYGQMGPEGGYEVSYDQRTAQEGMPKPPPQIRGQYRQKLDRNSEVQAGGFYVPIPGAKDVYGGNVRYVQRFADGGEADAMQMTVGTVPEGKPGAAAQVAKDVVRGAQYLPYDLLGLPVDIATMAMRPFGYNVEKPVGGSEYLIEKAAQAGIADRPTGSLAETASRIGMGFVNPAAAARQIPKGIAALEKGAETLGTGAVRAITGKPDISPEQIYQAMAEPKGILQLGAPAASRPIGSAINTEPEVMKLRQAVRDELDIGYLPERFDSAGGRAYLESYNAAKEKYGPQMEAIEKTLVPKLENYFTRQYGTVNDPLYQATLEGKYMPRAFYSPNNTFRWDKKTVVEITGLPPTKDDKLSMEHVNKLKELSAQGNEKAQAILGRAYDLADRAEAFHTPRSIAESLKNPQNFSYMVERLKAYNVKNPEDVIKTYVANAPKLKSPSPDDNFNTLEAVAVARYDTDIRKLLEEQAKNLPIPSFSSSSRMVSSMYPFKDLTEKTRQEIVRGKPVYQTTQMFGENIDYRDIVDYVLKAPLDKWQKMSIPELVIASHVNPANVTKPSKVARMADDGVELLPFQKIMGTAEYLPVKSKMLGDGAQWREITTKEGMRIEGGLMDHCLKKDSLGYCNRLLNKESKYFTLRDADGHPYVSIEMTKPMGQEKQDVPFNVIRQVKGYMNSKAVPAYGEEISDFLTAWENQIGVKLRPAENPDYLPEKFKPQQFGIQSPPENMAKGGMVDKPLYDRAA